MNTVLSIGNRCFIFLAFSSVVNLYVANAQDVSNEEASEVVQETSEQVESTVEQKVDIQQPVRDGLLQFSFEGTPWREVIQWIADETGSALHVGDLPTGSFTYSDPNTFSQQGAIDRINLFLLTQGFTIVRSDDLITVIDLNNPTSLKQLEVLAKLVTTEQLDSLTEHDVVKCIFSMGEIRAEDAVEELSALKLMTTPTVFSKTNRILITDTVRNLRTVKIILQAFEPSELDNGTVMKNLPLKHVAAEDILIVARPHLGLATGEMIGIDVSLSADLQGKNIYVTGVEDKVKLIENLVASLDVPDQKLDVNQGESVLKSHLIQNGDVETVYNVLLTLLAEKPVRLSMDKTTSSIVALAADDVQKEIEQTVSELQAAEPEFEVIPLKIADPYYVISLLEEMLDLPDPLLEDSDEVDVDVPKIDADPGNRRLFVRAKKHQIEQIKKMVEKLDVNNGLAGEDEEMYLVPVRGQQALALLEATAKFWQDENPVLLYPSLADHSLDQTERVISESSPSDALPQKTNFNPSLTRARVLAGQVLSQRQMIRCQQTPRGLLIQSKDVDALKQFYEKMQTISGPVDSVASPPIVFYLKYTKPDIAIHMLAELLDGGEAAVEAESGSLVNGYVSSDSSFLSSFVTSRAGTTTLSAGTITIVADTRLNRLIAQGTSEDIELVERYLKIIDKDNSITSVETYGKAHVVELVHTRASEVAAVIREAFAGRLNNSRAPGQSNGPQANSKNPQPVPNTQNSANSKDKKATDKKGATPQAPNLEPNMTIAVHEPSNSLIITAPDLLFAEVEQLVQLVDRRSEQSIQVITNTNATSIQPQLMEILSNGGTTTKGSKPSSTPSSKPQSTNKKPTASTLRQGSLR